MMLAGNDLSCVRGDRMLFQGIDFSLGAGELMQVQGKNGSGKTSLLRMLCGLSRPENGTISWQGTAIRELGDEYYQAIAYIGHLNGAKDDLTVIENLRISSALSGDEITVEAARSALNEVGLGDRAHLPVKVLSQGQRKRVSLARLLVSKSQLWILDEPLAALDVMAVEMVRKLLEKHLAEQGLVVMTTHQEINVSALKTVSLQLS